MQNYTNLLSTRFTVKPGDDQFDKVASRSFNEVNWKLGLVWSLALPTTLRLAAFRVFKRSLIADQTVEPTQVAGFNQFFDDPNTTVSRRYGLGLDHRFSSNLYGGIELSRRDLEVPVKGGGIVDRREEKLLRTYLYWTPHPNWALKLEYEREDFDNFAEPTPFVNPPNPPDVALDRRDPKALHHWGLALYDQAQIKRGTEAQELYQAACGKYSAALALAPNKPDVINDWGAALKGQAGLATGDASAALYKQAQEKLSAAEALRPGIASYNLACIHSLRGEYKECRKHLESARDHKSLPPFSYIKNDTDLNKVRQLEWFKELIKTLRIGKA